MTCNYTHRKAKSTSAQDAFAGKILPRQVGDTILPNTAIVQMVKDGKNVKYQQIADEESLAISLGGSGSLKPDPKMPGLAMGPIFAFGSSSELFNGIDSLAFTPSDGKPQNGPNTANLMGNG